MTEISYSWECSCSHTRTVSPYFSPNMAIAPAALASAVAISRVSTGSPSATQPLISRSTSAISAAWTVEEHFVPGQL
jgi:hypothetical protein